MLDIAWPELVVVGVVALVAVGPEDLPKVMHSLGRMVRRARRAFQMIGDQIDQLDYEAQVKDHLQKASQQAEKKEESGGKNVDPPEPRHES